MTKFIFGPLLALFLFPSMVEAKNLKNKERKLIIRKVVYGKSFSGKKLIGHKIYLEPQSGKRIAAIMTGGIHGNEYMGIADNFTAILSSQQNEILFKEFFLAGGVLFIVPQINPDGVQKNNRYSKLGKDLNRDFNYSDKINFLNQQESFYLVKWMEYELSKMKAQLVLAMDYHCCANALIYPEHKSKLVQNLYSNIYQRVYTSLNNHFKRNFKLGITKKIFGSSNSGTLKDYWYSVYGAASFTFEGSLPSNEKKFIGNHVNWWSDILKSVATLTPSQLTQLEQETGSAALVELKKSDFKIYSE